MVGLVAQNGASSGDPVAAGVLKGGSDVGKNPWYKNYPRDWMTDPKYLSLRLAERGFYRDFVDLIYIAGGKLRASHPRESGKDPGDIPDVSRIFPGQDRRTSRTLTGRLLDLSLLEHDGEFYTNPRAAKECDDGHDVRIARPRTEGEGEQKEKDKQKQQHTRPDGAGRGSDASLFPTDEQPKAEARSKTAGQRIQQAYWQRYEEHVGRPYPRSGKRDRREVIQANELADEYGEAAVLTAIEDRFGAYPRATAWADEHGLTEFGSFRKSVCGRLIALGAKSTSDSAASDARFARIFGRNGGRDA